MAVVPRLIVGPLTRGDLRPVPLVIGPLTRGDLRPVPLAVGPLPRGDLRPVPLVIGPLPRGDLRPVPLAVGPLPRGDLRPVPLAVGPLPRGDLRPVCRTTHTPAAASRDGIAATEALTAHRLSRDAGMGNLALGQEPCPAHIASAFLHQLQGSVAVMPAQCGQRRRGSSFVTAGRAGSATAAVTVTGCTPRLRFGHSCCCACQCTETSVMPSRRPISTALSPASHQVRAVVHCSGVTFP